MVENAIEWSRRVEWRSIMKEWSITVEEKREVEERGQRTKTKE